MNQNYWPSLDPPLKLRLKLHKVQTDAVREIAQSGFIGHCSADETKTLNTFISFYDERLLALIDRPLDKHEKVALDSVRLHIQVFRFFGNSTAIEKPGFVRLFSYACDVLEDLDQLEAHHGFVVHGPLFNNWVVLLAAFTILRLLHSELRQYLDYRRGEKAYFMAIDLFRKMSVNHNDLQARGIIIMAQLWTSQNIFRQNNGKPDGLCLRIRSRLAAGVVFDCFWWWRAEFQGQTNPYADLPHGMNNNGISHGVLDMPGPSSMFDQSLAAPLEEDRPINSEFTADMIPDWDWATSLEIPVDTGISNSLI
ncbi:hypothetical protein AbraIFM66951_001118 [Aspergillus brasiliensis]|uniref:Transcription factor domain-containing protein n=1 Tax=Aspergillus brasiliensis TaxID=319629 RepID=A0A9W5YX54_9EURO|nr:hypothetical protein AbraCBS73388_000634 [Aspergillus brasiliensis]GKZ48873.1 hypothetical protein AbraIFM66951_001118 [Aspergillus brasiliensis]